MISNVSDWVCDLIDVLHLRRIINQILPPFKTFSAIPRDVGPNTAPEARIAFQSPTLIAQAIKTPTAMGRKLPITAIIRPLVPTNFITLISISIPASITSKIRLDDMRMIHKNEINAQQKEFKEASK